MIRPPPRSPLFPSPPLFRSDIVAHISGWHREMGPALERLARGEKPVPAGVSYDDVDAWNAKFAAGKKGAPVADVLLEFDKSDRKSTRLNSSHSQISYAVFCL